MIINLLDDKKDFWFQWGALFWGFGLAVHWAGVFFFCKFTKDWEDRKIRELMEKEDKQ